MIFLRRFKPLHLSKGGKLSPEAFECEPDDKDGLSLTKVEGYLCSDAGIADYWYKHRRGDSGDRLGVARINLGKLMANRKVKPVEAKREGELYGELHFVITCPDEDLADLLAKEAVSLMPPMKGRYAKELALTSEHTEHEDLEPKS